MNDAQLAKIKWQCRRGMLELDLILSDFISTQLKTLSVQQLEAFESLLACQDPDIYAWLMGYETPDSSLLKGIVDVIQFKHCAR